MAKNKLGHRDGQQPDGYNGRESGLPALGTGGPRSEGTRRAILGAARATFAARGYEQTTIRAVAARAGVDASMVMRYFRSKAGLFTAAVTMDLQVPDLASVSASRRGELLVRHFISRWEDPLHDDEMIALLRTGSPARPSPNDFRPYSAS